LTEAGDAYNKTLMVGMKFQVAVTLETPLVWHAAGLHLRLSVNLVNDVETLVHIKPYK